MFKNVASQKLIVYAFDSTTNLPKTGDAANLTAYVSKDYGSVTVLGDTSATEMDATNGKGYYLFDLTQAETNADTLLFSAKSSTANIVILGMPAAVFTRPSGFSGLLIASGIVSADGVKWNGTAVATPNTAGIPKVDLTVLNGVAASAANLEKSASVIKRGSATGATTTTTLIDSTLTESGTDHWKGRIIIFTSGTLLYQASDITAFDPATDKITFTAMTAAASGGDSYVIV